MKKSHYTFLIFFILFAMSVFQEATAQNDVIIAVSVHHPRPTLSVINNYKGTDVKLKPKSFKITVKNNSIEAIDQPAPNGWTRTPSKFPPGSSTVTWTNKSDIPYGEEINLGNIHFGNAEKFSITCQWINAAGDIIYQTEKLWTDYNPHDPGVADSKTITGEGASYQVKWTPTTPPQGNSIAVRNPEPFNDPKSNRISIDLKDYLMIYLGAGSNSPSTKAKDDAYATNSIGFDANIFIPIIKKKNFNFGFNGGGEYFSSNNDNAPSSPNAFHVIGETSSTVAVTSSGSSKNAGFKLGVAPQVNFFIGKRIIISPMIEAGYMNMTNNGFSAVQTTNLDGTLYNYTLLSKTETKISGFALIPKVRLNYMFTKNIGMWVETNYTMGPTIINNISTFTPQDTPDENGQYNIFQLDNGTTTTVQTKTKFSSFGVHVGVVFSIIWDDGHKELEGGNLPLR